MYVGARPDNAQKMITDKAAFLGVYHLTDAERTALADPDFPMILELGGLPNLVLRYYRAHGLEMAELADCLAPATD